MVTRFLTTIRPRAAVYVRVSTTMQETEGTSLVTQERACRQYAEEHGFEVPDELVFRETFSGGELINRPQLSLLRRRLRAGHFDAMIFYALDRLTRDQSHLGVLVSEADEHGVQLRCVTEQFEESAIGKFIRSALVFKAELERADITERVVRGQRERVNSGKPMPGNRASYGYQWADDTKTRMEPDPLTEGVVRRIFHAIAAGQTGRSLAAALNAEGVPTPTGGSRWCVQTLAGIIRRPIYVGDYYANRWTHGKSKKSGKRTMVLTPRSEWKLLENIAPALVSRETAEAASARLEKNKSRATRNNRNPEAALLRGGFARCGYCGRVATVTNGTRDGSLYRCNPANVDRYGCPNYGVPTDVLDAEVWSAVVLRLEDPDLIAHEVERLLVDDEPIYAELAAREARLQEIGRRQQNLARSIAALANADASAPLEAELISLAEQARKLATEREAYARMTHERETIRARLVDVASWAPIVATESDRLTYDEKRLVLDAFDFQVKLWAKKDRDPQWKIAYRPVIVSQLLFGSGHNNGLVPDDIGLVWCDDRAELSTSAAD